VICTPSFSKALSGIRAARPAPGCKEHSMPSFANLVATEGTRATRFSCSRVSPGTNRLTGMGSPFPTCLFYSIQKAGARIHQVQLDFCIQFEKKRRKLQLICPLDEKNRGIP